MNSNYLKLLRHGILWGILILLFMANLPRLIAADTGATTTPAATASDKTNIWLTFGLDRVEWLQASFMGNPLWQYLAAFIYVTLAFYTSKVLDYLMQVQLRKFTSKTKTQVDDIILDLMRRPVKITLFVILLYVGLKVFAWPDWAAVFISNGFKVIVACTLSFLVLELVDLGMGIWQKHLEGLDGAMLDTQLFPVMRKSLKAFVIIVAILVTLQNLGMNVTGLLASLSIGGLALSLAAQDTLSNLFGAIALFADKPFRVGDRIQLDSIDGTVEAIGVRSTRIRHLDGYLVTVPNRTMANATLTNISKRPNIKTVMNVGVTYDTPAEKVEQAMRIIDSIYRPHPKTSDLIVSFNKFESSSLNILVVHWWDSIDMKEYLLGFQNLNLELKRRFDAEGIGFAFPSQTVYLRQDSDWRLINPNREPDACNSN